MHSPAGAEQAAHTAQRSALRRAMQPGEFASRFLLAPAENREALRLMSENDRKRVIELVLMELHRLEPKQLEVLLANLNGFVTRWTNFYVLNDDEAGITLRLLSMPEGSARDHLLTCAAQQWCYKDWPAAMAWAESLPSPGRESLVAAMASRTLQRGGESESVALAAKWVTEKATPAQRQSLGAQCVAFLAKSSPSAALQWARENMAGRPLANAVARLLAQQAATDPVAARRLVEEIPPGSARGIAACAVIAKQPDEESVRWLLTQASRESQGWRQVSNQWALRDPDAFKHFLATEKAEVVPVHLVDAGMDVISRNDAAGTVAWALTTGREKYVTSSLENFSNQDSAAAAAWILDHPATPLSDTAIYIVADRIFRSNPEASARWAIQLPEGPRRKVAMELLQERIQGASSLPQSERANLQRILGESPKER